MMRPTDQGSVSKGKNTKYKNFCLKEPLSISFIEKKKPLNAAFIISSFKYYEVAQRLPMLCTGFIFCKIHFHLHLNQVLRNIFCSLIYMLLDF